MKQLIPLFVSLCLWSACTLKQEADMIVHHARVYTVDEAFSTAEAIAVKDGKFVGIGTNEEVLEDFEAPIVLDAEGEFLYPGLIDAHCHFYGLGTSLQQVDLMGTQSFEEVIARMQAYQKTNPFPYITGRGWDQEDWEVKEFPTNERLNELWPDIPVVIGRVDGHAALANDKALELAEVNSNTVISGGKLLSKNGKLTGLLIDNAVDKVMGKAIPQADEAYNIKALTDAERMTLSYGLTTLSDAGLSLQTIDLIDSLQSIGMIQSRIYAMVSASRDHIGKLEKRGAWYKDKLQVNSVKFYLDGALGSRGACLLHPYHDQPEWSGFLLNTVEDFEKTAAKLSEMGFQLNTHCIGDSANRIATRIYEKYTRGTDLRWRIEHAQVINEADFEAFSNPNILPSVQPTHATSDMYWAEKRLGPERIKGAYAYKRLLDINGTLALGTDFPVEKVSPFLTFYAAVGRQDLEGYPEGGFEAENALSREETLRGMTIWAAYANMQENEVGSIEVGKKADFILSHTDLMHAPLSQIPDTQVNSVFIGGRHVFER